MEKVPVGRSISHAYEFLFGRIFQIIGMAWLPALLYATGYYFWLQNVVTWVAPLTKDHDTLVRGILASCGVLLLALICRAVIGISLTQEALGIRKDITLAHFVVGPRETRLFFAQVRVILLILALDVALVAIVIFGLGAATKYGAAIPPSPLIAGKSLVVVGAIVAACLLYVAFVLAVMKLTFLLTAVASVERHASIRRAWHLAGGSGWRIIAILLGVFLPVAAIAAGAIYFTIGADAAAAMHIGTPASVERMHAMLQFYAAHAMMLAAIAGVASIVVGALFAGATAAAYRTVTGHEEAEPEDDDALVAPLLVPGHGHSDEPLPAVSDHGHGGQDEAHDSHGNDHGHGGHGHDNGHGQTDHGHGESNGHGHGGHDESHGHGGRDEAHGHGHDDDAEEDDNGHDDEHGQDDQGHDDGHGHKSHDDGHGGHGHDDHGRNGHGHDDGHHHHAKAA